jgi:hypothetical protein
MGFSALPNSFSTGERNWTAARGNESADFTTRTVHAPTDLSPRSTYARTHANATVAIGHDTLAEFSREADIPYDVCTATDYGRISSALQQTYAAAEDGVWDTYEEEYDDSTTIPHYKALALDPGRRLPDGAIEFYESTDDILAAYAIAAKSCIGGPSDDWVTFNTALSKRIPDDSPDAKRRNLFRTAVQQAVRAAASAIVGDYDEHPTHESLSDVKEPETTERAATAAWYFLQQYLNRDDDAGELYPRDERLADDSWDDCDESEWCNMHFRYPTLVLPQSPKLRRRAWRMSDEGALIRSPHRMCSDGRVFGSVRRKADSGSVIIDTSGSMHLSSDDIDEIMTALPGVTVATYCSDGDHDGELRIVARKGRRAGKDDLTDRNWGGNGVDGPALRWLAKQPAPRYWVCDGVVTGIYDNTSPNLRTECDRLTRRYDITRIHSIHHLRDMFGNS